MNVSRLGEVKGSCRGTKMMKGECDEEAWTEGLEEAGRVMGGPHGARKSKSIW